MSKRTLNFIYKTHIHTHMTNLENPTPRDKRVVKAHKKRYVEDKNLSTIAEEMGYSYETIRDYFRDDSVERIKQLYDEDELEFLRLQLFQEVKEAKDRANSYLGKAVSQEDVDAVEYIRAAKEEQQVPMRFIKALQELGIIDKQPDKEVHEKESGESVTFNMRYTDQEDEEESVEAES